ncbi:MAG TPA: hypothetical protein VMR62_35170 [Bryobacteraceae bacterium]|nr:hypothetical protein [Bryobacteraceae bacterium]
MDKYSLETRQSAQKELDALGDPLFTRIDKRILALVENPVTGALYIIDDARKRVSITRSTPPRRV